jgi:hypothetical protein
LSFLPSWVARCFPSIVAWHATRSPHTLSLVVFKLVFAARLSFFRISLPLVQVAGGLIHAGMGWFLVSRQDPKLPPVPSPRSTKPSYGSVEAKSFYPLYVSHHGRADLYRGSSFLLSGLTRDLASLTTLSPTPECCGDPHPQRDRVFSYAYAPRMTASINSETARGRLPVIALVLTLDRRHLDHLERCPVAPEISSDRRTRASKFGYPQSEFLKIKGVSSRAGKRYPWFLFRFVIVERLTSPQRSRLPTR